MKWLLVVTFAVAGSVGCRDDDALPRSTEAPRARRLIKTPPGKIRAVPPHAIFAGGVGPYKLGRPLNDALDLVSGGPRVVVVNFDGVLDYHYVPAEEGSIIIGASRSEKPISFISILDPKIAKTKTGLSVGASEKALVKELGAGDDKAAAMRDPRIVSFAKFPTLRFAMAKGKVRAIIVSGLPAPPILAPAPVAPPKQQDEAAEKKLKRSSKSVRKPKPKSKLKLRMCNAGELATHRKAILVEAGTTMASNPQIAYGCFVGDEPGAMVRDGNHIVMVGGEPGKFRVIARAQLASVAFASVVDVNGDQRHEVAIARVVRTTKRLVARVEVLRVEGNRLQPLASKAIYILHAETVEWTGARLRDIDLLLEFTVRNRKLQVGGLYLHGGDSRARMMAPLMPVAMKVRSPPPTIARPKHAKIDAGVATSASDAGVAVPRKRGDAGRKRPRKRAK